jgi:hypothetical protein
MASATANVPETRALLSGLENDVIGVVIGMRKLLVENLLVFPIFVEYMDYHRDTTTLEQIK